MPLLNRIFPGLLLLAATLLACPPAAPAQAPAPAPAAAPSAETCASAVTQLDIDTCFAAQFKDANLRLNHLYRAALLALESELDSARTRSATDELASDSAAILDLKSAQDAWVKYRDLQCKAAGQQVQGGSIQPTVVSQCMTLLTTHRIDEIRAAYEIGGRKLE